MLQEGNETVTNCDTFKLKAKDGKMRNTDMLDAEGIFRRYWNDLIIDLNKEGSQLYDKIVQLKLKSSKDGWKCS